MSRSVLTTTIGAPPVGQTSQELAAISPPAGTAPAVTKLWLEVTGKCQLACVQCYAGSGPGGTHGTLSASQWRDVIREAAACGVRKVQFIGGEPTLRPDLPSLIAHATACGLGVEVFTNLVSMPERLWECFSVNRVSVATSYYTDDPEQHAMITGRGTLARTRDNIANALRLGLELRVGLIGVLEGQRVSQAREDLIRLGVEPARIGYDRLRQVGRGVREPEIGNTPGQLCGHCARGVAAVSSDGDVWPCVFARWQPLGNVLADGLATVLGEPLAAARQALYGLGAPAALDGCNPHDSPPDTCGPDLGCKPK
jgi:MoaA/NifB/PqqE/SkfB family radical SAM enzyme